MNTTFIGIKDFRQNMAKISYKAYKKNERLIVLRKNKPLFELRPLSPKGSFTESFIHDIKKSRTQAKKGEVYTQEEIMSEFGL